jgi:NADP-dependent 3-hydroxy acid dehydrogenase YdfG
MELLKLPTLACIAALPLLLLLLLWRRRLRTCVPGNGRVVVISGCDSGFGFMLAVQLFERGFSVFAACLTPAGVERLRAHARLQHDVPTAFLQPLLLDITNETSVARAVEVKMSSNSMNAP